MVLLFSLSFLVVLFLLRGVAWPLVLWVVLRFPFSFLRAAAFLLLLWVGLLSPPLLLGAALHLPSLGGVLGGATFALSSVGWCCSTPTKKGKKKRKEKQRKSFIKDLCRKRGLTGGNRSIWAVFPRQILQPFFFDVFRPRKKRKKEKQRENKKNKTKKKRKHFFNEKN